MFNWLKRLFQTEPPPSISLPGAVNSEGVARIGAATQGIVLPFPSHTVYEDPPKTTQQELIDRIRGDQMQWRENFDRGVREDQEEERRRRRQQDEDDDTLLNTVVAEEIATAIDTSSGSSPDPDTGSFGGFSGGDSGGAGASDVWDSSSSSSTGSDDSSV